MTVQTETVPATDLDRVAVDTVRTLAMDTIQKAGSGHPGTAMALAPIWSAKHQAPTVGRSGGRARTGDQLSESRK